MVRNCGVLILLLLCATPDLWALSLSVPPIPKGCHLTGGDGVITLYSYHQDETTPIDLAKTASEEIAHVFRSRDGGSHPMDVRTLRLIDQIQDHFGVETMEIISGYRSPHDNQTLKATGHHVARESRHMRGDAVDLHIDEISEAAVRDYVISLKCGGVGFYPAQHFVHIDFGPVRHWSESAAGRQLIGQRPIVVTTEKNYYFKTDRVHLTWQQAPHAPIVLEHFRKGQWQTLQTYKQLTTLTRQHYGKHRLRIGTAYSNEFYFKQH